MNQTDQPPYGNVRVKALAKGIDFDADEEDATRIFFERVKATYLQGRHLIPGPAQIILDVTIQEIDDLIAKCGYSDKVFTNILCFPRMLTLVHEMMVLQTPAPPLPAGGINLN